MKVVVPKLEGLLRLLAVGFLVLSVCLVCFDSQTKILYYTMREKATFRDLDALLNLVCIDCVAAGYNLLRLCLCPALGWFNFKGSPKCSFTKLAWVYFLLDQAVAYTVFGANSGSIAAANLAVTGATSFQWIKVCNKFTKFCIQIGAALLCNLMASLLLAATSSISAFNLFRLYSPKAFLLLKASPPPQ